MTMSYYWSIRKQRLHSTRCRSCQPTLQTPFRGVEIDLSSAREGITRARARAMSQTTPATRGKTRTRRSVLLRTTVRCSSKDIFPSTIFPLRFAHEGSRDGGIRHAVGRTFTLVNPSSSRSVFFIILVFVSVRVAVSPAPPRYN